MKKGTYKHSPEMKKYLSEKRKGIVFSEETKKKISENHARTWLGRKHTEESKRKIGDKHKGKLVSIDTRKKLGGENCHWWKGGVTPVYIKIRDSYEMRQWIKSILERDNYTCLHCGDNKGGNLEVDHIIPFSKILDKMIFEQGNENLYEKSLKYNLLWDVNNGRTLCHDCHKKTDTYGRRANNYKLN